MSYQLKLDPKSRKAARFISKLQKMIQESLIDSGKTQQQVAQKLGVDRSVVNRRLKGSANLTARSIAEFAYALDKDITITFSDKPFRHAANVDFSSSTNENVELLEMRRMGQPSASGTLGSTKPYTLESTAS